MGREVTGVRVELKTPYAKVKPKVPTDIDQEVNPKSPEGNNEVKDCEVKECTSEVPRAENSHEKEDVLAVKSTNFEDGKPDVKSVGNANTPLKSSDTTVDKQVCESPIAVETPVCPSAINSKSPSSSKKSQPSTPLLARRHLDDEDNWSMASSTGTSRTTRSKTTVGVAPTFSISERLEKRKEYYAKLEEKRKALEAEKQEYEARTKEEEAAAIKHLRKSMVVKAKPVPNFYYEKPSPKKELKKLPTTRAVSPKLGRRMSCSDAVSSSSEQKVCGRVLRHSLGGQKEASISTPTSTSKKKDPLVGNGVSKLKDRSKQVKETTQRSPKLNPDISVQS